MLLSTEIRSIISGSVLLLLLCLLLTPTSAGTATAEMILQGNLARVAEAPHGNFTAHPLSGEAPLTVQFTDLSSGNGDLSWEWDFDGDSVIDSTLPDPTHVYTAVGSYTVTLTVSNLLGESSFTQYNYITVVPSSGGGGPLGELIEPEVSPAEIPLTNELTPAPTEIPPPITITEETNFQLPDLIFRTAILEVVTGEGVTEQQQVIVETGENNALPSGVTLSGDPPSVITVVREDMVVVIETAGLTLDEAGNYAGVVTSVEVTTTPVVAEFTQGTTEVYFDLQLDLYPEDGKIGTTITEGVDPEVFAQFQEVAAQNNAVIENVLFTITVEKTNISETGAATIWTKVPKEWVEANGGIEAIWAVRLGDDGMNELLKAEYDSTYVSPIPDAQGNTEYYVFRIESPNGLSVFGVAAIKVKEAAGAGQSSQISFSPLTFVGGMVTWLVENPLVIAMVMLVSSGITYFRWNRPRRYEKPGILEPPEGGPHGAWESLIETDQHRALAAIVEILNNIDSQIEELEDTLLDRAPGFAFTSQEAEGIVEKFFYSCQVAEERIKKAAGDDHITKEQVDRLNMQLKGAVDRMIMVSQPSAVLVPLIQAKVGAEEGK